MSGPSAEAEYSIAAVSKLTGVSCHALRVWERRYGFPVPHRSASGHRRYTPEQVRTLLRVAELTQEGRAIGDLIAAIRDGRLPLEAAPMPAVAPGDPDGVSELLQLLGAGDHTAGEACFERLAGRHDPFDLVVQVIEPALVDTGERWFRRELEVFQERSVSAFLRRKLALMIDEARRGNKHPSHTILLGTVQGDRHGGGVLISQFFLERSGWRVLDLGVDLPVREYQNAVTAWHPDALGLSFVLSRNINKRFQELGRIRGLPIFVGGRSILNYQALARRNGLIPVPGPISSAVAQLLVEFDAWSSVRRAPPEGG